MRYAIAVCVILGAQPLLAAEAPEITFVSARERVVLKGHRDPVHCVAFSPDGKILASGAGESDSVGLRFRGEVRLWDVASGKLLATLKGFGGEVYNVAFSPDGKKVGGSSRKTIIWDVASKKRLVVIWNAPSFGFCPDSKLVYTSRQDGWHIRDHETGKKVHTLKGRPLDFSRDGKMAASAGADGQIALWDAKTWQPKGTLKGHKTQSL